MVRNIGKYVEDAHVFYKQLAAELGNPEDTDHASRVARAVLHTLRDHISPEESMHLISQLPMILKGVYVDGWKMTSKHIHTKTIDEFIDDVRLHSLRTAGRDFGTNEQARETILCVLRVMRRYVDEGEMKDIKAQLPQSLAAFFP